MKINLKIFNQIQSLCSWKWDKIQEFPALNMIPWISVRISERRQSILQCVPETVMYITTTDRVKKIASTHCIVEKCHQLSCPLITYFCTSALQLLISTSSHLCWTPSFFHYSTQPLECSFNFKSSIFQILWVFLISRMFAFKIL